MTEPGDDERRDRPPAGRPGEPTSRAGGEARDADETDSAGHSESGPGRAGRHESATDREDHRDQLPGHPPGPPRQSADTGRSKPRRDPVQERFDGEVDLHEIATWEARTRLDRFAIRLTNALQSTKRWLLLIVAFALFGGQLVVAGALVLEAPILGYLAAISAVPALLLAGYIWYRDPTTREPLVTLAVTFLLGVVFAGIAGVVNGITEPFFNIFGIVGLSLFYFLVVGPIEETVKWLAVRVYAYRSDAFQTVIDGVVYGAMAGVGFAAIENLTYILIFGAQTTTNGLVVLQEDAFAIATQRAFVGPGHVVFSAWAGFYLGLAKFNRSKRGPIVVKGLIIAAFIHGLYNTLVTVLPLTLVSFVFFLVVYHGFWFSLLFRKVRRYRELYRRRAAHRAS
jgi:RsiW-degrading membrane proteinase PrsW (M82 family)